jgi:hypothetical protein
MTDKQKEYSRKYYQIHKDKYKEYYQIHKNEKGEYNKKWRLTHIEEQRKHAKQYRKAHKDKVRNWQYKLLYGITLADIEEILRQQNYRCPICGKLIEIGRRSAGVDHDHQTGQIRGILCYQCNLILGYAQDNKMILQKAIDYLEKK